MKSTILKSLLLSAGVVVLSSAGVQAQQQQKSANTGVVLSVKNGSVTANLKSKSMTQQEAAQRLVSMLGLSDKHTYTQVSSTSDKLGFTHALYQQYYQGILVEGGKVLLHSKGGIVENINGRVAQLGNVTTAPSISEKEAFVFAKNNLDIIKLMKQYPAALVIAPVSSNNASSKTYALVYKVRIDGKTAEGKVVMMNVFVDASTGMVLNKISLIAHTDVNANAHTMYSGIRTIVTDSTSTGFRLRDNGRKIETYDVAGKEVDENSVDFFLDPRDYYNTTTNWVEQPAVMTMTLNNVTNNMLTGLGFQNGKFVTSLMVKGDPINNELVAWPDVKLSPSATATLPIISKNVYVFPEDLNYSGGFGKLNLFGNQEVSDSAFFSLTSIAPGIYPWSDAQGNAGSYEVSLKKNPALDAHWGMEMTHDFYNQVFSRNSYDGNGSLVKNYMNGMWPQSLSQNNAAAMPAPYFSMVYGLGDGNNMDPVVGLDVMGHEFTHMVTETNGNGGLDYESEPGALNESFSDILGTCIEFFTKGQEANWTIGEGVILTTPGFFRSMSNPKLAENPDTYKGQYWIPTENPDQSNDNGGVHYNSGVQNKWFYLLCQGGSGTNDKGDSYNVTGISMTKAQQIAYRNLTTYLLPDAQFMDAYTGSLQATLDLYGNDTTTQEYKSVKQAWYAVGIGEADSATAINEITVSQNDLKLYPNPAIGNVTISSAISQPLEAQVLNVIGVPVMNIKISKGLNPVNISTLTKGVYLIRYNTGVKGYVQKMTVL